MEPSKGLKHRLGAPFWIGCVLGPILFLLFNTTVIRDRSTFELFAFFAVIFFCPIGGVTFQAIHDLFLAYQLRLFRILDFGIFAGVVVALFVAGFGLYTAPNLPLNPFQNKTFGIAAATIGLLLVAYALRVQMARPSSQPVSSEESPRETLPDNIRTFAAGGFTFLALQGMVQGLFVFVASVTAGQPKWLELGGSVVFGCIGIALGLALLMGNLRALHWVRLLLLLAVAGGCIELVMPLLKTGASHRSNNSADLIVNLALLVTLSWKRSPSNFANVGGVK